MDLGLKDQVVLITGASRGLGRAAAEAFAAEGARLALCSHSAEIETAAEAIRAKYDRPVLAVQADLTSREDIDRYVAAAAEAYGAIDILVTNVAGPKPGGFLELQAGDWENAISASPRHAAPTSSTLPGRMMRWASVATVSVPTSAPAPCAAFSTPYPVEPAWKYQSA